MNKLIIYGGLLALGLAMKNKSAANAAAAANSGDEALMPSTPVSTSQAVSQIYDSTPNKAKKIEEPSPVMTMPRDPSPAPSIAKGEPTPVYITPQEEDPRIAIRLAVAQKYGADPLQLDLNQPEIQFWDGQAGVTRSQPNFIYKANQLFLSDKVQVTQPIPPTILSQNSGSTAQIQPYNQQVKITLPTYF